MSDTPRNTRSLVIGTLLALLSASCLVAFALVAGSTDYPSGPPVAAVEPTTSAPAVKLTARTKKDSDRPKVRPGRENDPTAPIVLGIQITEPEPRDEDPNRDRDGRRDGDGKRDGDGDRKGAKGSRKPSHGPADRDSDGTQGPPQVAKPTTDSPDSDNDDAHDPPGNAYGHDKKANGSSSKGSSPSSKGGPPAHAQANGLDKQSSAANDHSSGPPAHAQSDNTSEPSSPGSSSSSGDSSSQDDDASSEGDSKGGPPAHAQANGHEKKSKD